MGISGVWCGGLISRWVVWKWMWVGVWGATERDGDGGGLGLRVGCGIPLFVCLELKMSIIDRKSEGIRHLL